MFEASKYFKQIRLIMNKCDYNQNQMFDTKSKTIQQMKIEDIGPCNTIGFESKGEGRVKWAP